MLLAVDVGNSHIVLGLYRGKEIVNSWRISSDKTKTFHEWSVIIGGLFNRSGIEWKQVSKIILSSVVPGLTLEIKRMCQFYLGIEPLIVTESVDAGIGINVDNPAEVGADRLANTVGAFQKYGGPVIVVDFGTATTFDAVGPTGDYLGGAIAPGVGISIEALFSQAAQLPRVDLRKPENVIGRSTVDSMQAGIMYGFVGQVDEVVSRMKKELGGTTKIVVATGGYAHLVAHECSEIEKVDEHLTLDGLRIMADRIKA